MMDALHPFQSSGLPNPQLSFYGYLGIAIIIISEVLLFLRVHIIGVYFTPIVWTGYILIIDAVNYKRNGQSLILTRTKEFRAMLVWSVMCWLIFEAYNLYLQNWKYIGLPENIVLRWIGYLWSFATIFPAILETAELFGSYFTSKRVKPTQFVVQYFVISILLGVVCLVVPFLVAQNIAAKLFALVWIGFFFFLDPINYLCGGRSIFKDIQEGNYSMVIGLALSGLVCGILWEFWNYWAAAKWIYMVPLSFTGPKIFEMPLIGYLGFIPFALECFVMQEFLLTLFPFLTNKRVD